MPSPSRFLAHAVRQSLSPLRAAIRHWVLSAFPRTSLSTVDYDRPVGDAGLFGPDSATGRVHSDFPGMLAGGLAALTLQTLHPLALAGVWDHSTIAPVFRAALDDGIASRACQRMGVPAGVLAEWPGG